MKFENATAVEQICWQMKQADYVRGSNRRRINDLFNGVPPYDNQEAEENNITVNVNFLESTRLGHDARSQFYNAFLKPGNFFTVKTDMGPVHKRQPYGNIVTKEVNRVMKKSLPYFETHRNKIASLVLHGIGPGRWPDQHRWRPSACGVEDVLVPATTYLTMENLPFFALYKQLTAPELIALTQKPEVDPGWNMELVKKCVEWLDSESMALLGTNWPEIWSPEKMAERVKGDGGFYAGDQVPTINCFDFYYYDADSKDQGWRRRIILDAWSSPSSTGQLARSTGSIYKNTDSFLYNSKDEKFADDWQNIVAFQFADLSAVSPFRYHSIRSLGFLLYAVCHLQNRMRCRFNEAVFEALMMYFRVKTVDDAQRVLKVELVNRGIIEEGINPLTAQERYQVNTALVQLGLMENQRIINENAASYKPNTDYSQGGVEKTRFQVMAETNSISALVSAGLSQAYAYSTFEFQEIFRRFCQPNSKDVDIIRARARIFQQGVPDKMLCPEYWDLEVERVMGAGNKTLEMQIAQQLMEWRDKFDPEPQRQILKDSVLAITDDAARADSLVPDNPVKVTDSVHDAQLAIGTLMLGLPVAVQTGINHIEYVGTLLTNAIQLITRWEQTQMLPDPEEIMGLANIAEHAKQHIEILAADPQMGPLVKQYAKAYTDIMNKVKEYSQQAAQQQQAQGPQMDPEKMAKIQADQLAAQTKQENARRSHAERTAQKRITFEQQTKQRTMEHELEMARKTSMAEIELATKQALAQIDLEKEKLKQQEKAAQKQTSNAPNESTTSGT